MRLVLSVLPHLMAKLEAEAGARGVKPQVLATMALADHLDGRCGAVMKTATAAGASAERGRGRPKGGSVEHEATYTAIMEGDPEAVKAELIRCGFFPPGAKVTTEGDRKTFFGGSWNTLMDDPLKEIEHVIEPNPEDETGHELRYLLIHRSWKSPKSDPDESSSVRTLSRSELWNLVKKEI